LTANKSVAELNSWANSATAAEFKGKTTTDIAKAVLANLGLTQPGLEAWLAGQLTAGGGVAKAGETMLSLLNDYSNMTADATFGSFATTFNAKSAASQALSLTAGTATGTYAAVSTVVVNTALTLTSAVQTSTGTTGDDTFTAAAGAWGTGDVVNGGAGTDTLNATITGTGPTQSATSLVGVEVLNVTASPNPATLDLTGVTGLTQVNNVSSANGATLSVTGLGNVVNTTITGGNTSTSIAYATAAVASTTADAATVSLKGTAAGSSFTTSGVETLTINSGTSANTLSSVSAAGMTRLVITGDQALTILGTVGNSGTTTPTTAYDASAATGAVTLTQTGSGLGTSGAGVTVTGPTAATAGAFTVTTGGNNDTVTLGANANTVTTGALNDTITSGGGANTITPGTGNDTINAGAGVDTIRFAEVGATNADTINAFGATDVIAINLGAAAVTGTSAAAATASTAFGVVPTGATSPVLQNVAGTATANAVTFQAIAPNATATSGTVATTSNVIALNGAYTDGTAAGVVSALGTSATTGITTAAAGKFLLVTYSVGNIAQVWSYGGDGVGPTGGNQAVDTNITSDELSLVATLNGVALSGLTAANFSTYLTPVAASTTVSNAGQTINLTGTANTVLSTANAAGQFLTAGADTINVGVGTMPTGAASATSGLTIIDPTTGDADVLNATNLVGGANTGFAGGAILISGVETINLNMLVANQTFSASAITPGTTQFGLTGTANFINTGMPNGGGITLGAGYTGQATTALASTSGSADSLVINLSGSTATSPTVGASLINVGSGVESSTVNVTAASSIRLSAADGAIAVANGGLFGPAASDITAVNLAGTGNLTVYGSSAALDTMILNGSGVGYTGALTLNVSGANSAAMDFVNGGAVSGIRTIDVSLLAAGNAMTAAHTITLPTVTGGGTVTVNNAPTGSSSVTNMTGLTVVQSGSALTDSLTVALGANATGNLATGGIVATGTETLTITNAGASTTTTTLALITLADAAGNQTVTVSGAGNYVLNTVIADSLTTTGVTGTVSATLGNTSGGAVFTGGAGATTIVGTALADNITTGAGNDTITGGNGQDLITTGIGTDTINLAITNANSDRITDFAVGSGGDVLRVAAGTANNVAHGATAAVTADFITTGTGVNATGNITGAAAAFIYRISVETVSSFSTDGASVLNAIATGAGTSGTITAANAADVLYFAISDGTNIGIYRGQANLVAADTAVLVDEIALVGVLQNTTLASLTFNNFSFAA